MESVDINSLPALTAFARSFVGAHPSGGVFGLQGDLGVGKTTFVREVIQVLCETHRQTVPRVISPTYVLHQLYETHPSVDHFDLYRLEAVSSESLLEIGYYESIDRADQGGFVFVEWPERLPAGYQPPATLSFQFTPAGRQIALIQSAN